MRTDALQSLFESLNASDVRYLIVGGLAVVAHGYLRFTADVDLVLAMNPENIERAIRTFETLGYRPRVPVPIEDFSDSSKRKQWSEEKKMVVFSLASDRNKETFIDIFVESPFDFDAEYAQAYRSEIRVGLFVPFVRLETLLDMKRRTGRDKDRLDAETLTKIRDLRETSDD
jgi:hypothetical protein